MQDHDWNDLKYLLALQRAGTLSEAGRRSGVSETTVARRLKSLERSLTIKLFFRNDRGAYELTEPARAILSHIETIEQENIALRERLGQISGKITGTVRLSSVPMIIQRVLVPNLEKLQMSHPDIAIELVPEARNVDLTKREADLAIRFSRPVQGGLATKAQKLGDLEFEAFCAQGITQDEENHLDWITYDDTSASLPQARWSETLQRQSGGRSSALRVADIDTAIEAAAHGYGKAILPKMACLSDVRLRPARSSTKHQSMTRDLWLLSHADTDASLSIKAVKTWLNELSWT